MIQTPAIVTFANQKGGVGKTTLCVTFANYLVMKGVRVVVVDCDAQRSIHKCRTFDLKTYGDTDVLYDVVPQDVKDTDAITSLMEKLHNDPSIEIALIDSPGSLNAPGLVPMFVNSDIIVIPFQYEYTTISSTAAFLLFMDRLRNAIGDRMGTILFLVPNKYDGRIGKRSEIRFWDETRDKFSKYGTVTAKIGLRVDMQRISTMANLDRQDALVGNAFDAIYRAIFGTDTPRRPISLKGVQLTENNDPRRKKAQNADTATEKAPSPEGKEDKDNSQDNS